MARFSRPSIARRTVYPAGRLKSSANRRWLACGERHPVCFDEMVGERVEFRAWLAAVTSRVSNVSSLVVVKGGKNHALTLARVVRLPTAMLRFLGKIYAALSRHQNRDL